MAGMQCTQSGKCRQVKDRRQQTRRTAQRRRDRGDQGLTPRIPLRRKHTPRVRPRRGLHPPGELPKAILQNLESRRNRTQRSAFVTPYVRDKLSEWAETAGRQHPIADSKTSSRPAWSQYLADHRDVLCAERYRKAKRDHRWV